MEVQIESSTSIPQVNRSAEPIEIPITVFDRYAPSYHISAIFAFSPPTPSNAAMIDGLVKTLVHFPTLAGKLGYTSSGTTNRPRRRPCVLVGGQGGGVLVFEATVASKLADHLPLQPGQELEPLCPPWRDVEAPPLLQVQLNRFKCGGLIIGVTNCHRVADGQSISNFCIAWGQAVRGVPIDPLPVYNKSWLKPRSPPRCEYEHWGTEFKPISPDQKYAFPQCYTTTQPSNVTNILLHYSPEFIAKLQSQVKEKFTIFELLFAHVWRKITTVRGLDHGSSTTAKISVNGRRRLKPAIPNEYFGNLVLTAYSNANAEGLIEGGLAEAARTVHKAVVDVGEDYFRSFIDFGAIYEEEDLARAGEEFETNVLLPDLEADSLLGFQFHKVDFGGGGALRAFLLGWVPVDGVTLFIPSLQEEGGIDVFVGLLEVHATALKKISHSLD